MQVKIIREAGYDEAHYSTVNGKSDISVKVICDSISEKGKRITTLECSYPRIIHSELKTHRMLSTNSASSRAIPFGKMIEQLKGVPVRFGAASKGMQDNGEDYKELICNPETLNFNNPEDSWNMVKYDVIAWAQSFYDAGFHKQIYNRLLEPFQMMKTVITATEWNNFFHLRLDSAADPTIYELAHCMKEAMDKSTPKLLKAGHYHLPYVVTGEDYLEEPTQVYMIKEGDIVNLISLERAIKVSCARCAAVSFRNTNYGLDKCIEVYNRLVNTDRVHGSALEHVATPMDITKCDDGSYDPSVWQAGVSHIDRNGKLWSGNFSGWIQYRKTIPNEGV